jgi:tRNA threonylcarbamoyladenosine biosynthesis protein TsaB
MTNRSDPAGKVRSGLSQGFAESRGGVILGIETGSRSCSVAVFKDGLPVAHEIEDTDHGQATMLMPMIERVRAKAGYDYAELERIAVAVGPGSFTGIRVGLAAALGLSLASGVPAVGISSFQAVAASVTHAPDVRGFRTFVLLDSRREEPFFVEIGADDTFKAPPAVIGVADFDAMLATAGLSIVVGDAPAIARGPKHFPRHVRLVPISPNALWVAALADDPAGRFDLPPKPVYIRPPDVTMPKPKQP